MPKPQEGESRSEFMERCVPMVLRDGAAENNQQAVAICSSLWEDKTVQLIDKIRSRKNRQSKFGYGITTADNYVRQSLMECGDSGIFDGVDKGQLVKEAANKLVHANEDMVVEDSATSRGDFKRIVPEGVDAPKGTLMVFRNVITTPREDRDKDILVTSGAELDPKSPLLWQHLHHFPIGKTLKTIEHTDDVLRVATALLDMNELTEDAAKLIEAEVLRISHGFRALDFEERDPMSGFKVTQFEIMEQSLVSVPSNRDAEIEMFARGKLASSFFRAHAKHYYDQRPAQSPGWTSSVKVKVGGAEVEIPVSGNEVTEPVLAPVAEKEKVREEIRSRLHQQPKSQRINTKGFEVEREQLEAHKLEYDWAARFIGCEIKDLMVVSTHVPDLRKGGYFRAERKLTNEWTLKDTRNLTRDGKEEPPLHETVEINSKERDTFLDEGLLFYQKNDGDKLVVKHFPTWSGNVVVTYAKDMAGGDLIDDCWEEADINNPLKGEAFSLTGKFIEPSGETVGDVFLEQKNKTWLTRSIRLLRERGKNMKARGAILQGPPGTGKTLSGRILLNELKGQVTFIWVSARDFWRTGAVGGICHAFKMAAELGPSIIFFEDVDNWLSSHSTDLMKTEMDGIEQRSGVFTMLTTNYPEQIPDALIDRPGRFHDVCEYHLPGEKVRLEMLRKWTEDVEEKALLKLAKQTDGYSGAHMYELCEFAKTLAEESDDGCMKQALNDALVKINEQRELINSHQLAGSTYRPGRREVEAYEKRFETTVEWEKTGDGKVVPEAPKEIGLPEAVRLVLTKANVNEDRDLLLRLRKALDALFEVEASDRQVETFREVVRT